MAYNPNAPHPMRTNAAIDQLSFRDALVQQFSDGSERDIDRAVGYPKTRELNFKYFWQRYERDPLARAIIDKPTGDTWQEAPEITDDLEDDDPDRETTDFERDVEQLLDGEPLRRSLLHRMRVVDKFAELGEYAAVVLGFADGGELTDEVQENQLNGLDDLAYVAVFPQDRVEYELDEDLNSERYRLPEYYDIQTTEDGDSQRIHHSRVVHIPGEDSLEDDLTSMPALLPVLDRLIDIEKIYAASGEAFWRAGYQGITVNPPTDQSGQPYRFDDDGDELEEQINQYIHNFRRVIFPSGGEVETLDSNISSPKDHIEQEIKPISAEVGIPQSILMGNETGERATSEDSKMWSSTIGSRRNNYAEPLIFRAIVDRLIMVGVVADPQGEGYTVDFLPLEEPSQEQLADIMSTKAKALKDASGNKPDTVLSVPEVRSLIFDIDPEYGAEAPIDEPEVEEPELDEDMVAEIAAEQQEEFERMRGDGPPAPEAVADGGETE